MTALFWLVACVGPKAFPDAAAVYDEAVLTASGRSSLESVARYRVQPVGDGFRIATERTEGKVLQGETTVMAYDSRTPRRSDAWPLVLQHAIAAVPTDIRLDATGRPVALVDAEAWVDAAMGAMAEAPVPPGAGADPQLVDPEGYVASLARTFPGVPARGPWVREERIAGLQAVREEVCARAGRTDGARTVRCEGVCRADDDPRGTLFGATCWSEVLVDRRGLRQIETGYSGTLVRSGADGQAEDLPVAGQRLVVRVSP